jgi:hypothetical protein
MNSVYIALFALFVTAVVVALIDTFFGMAYQRARTWRRVQCIFGKHRPGFVQNSSGGRNVQLCDYCDKIVREYEVTKSQAQHSADRIRRIK